MTFETGTFLSMMTDDQVADDVLPSDIALAARAAKLHERVKQRDRHFRRSVMADGVMGVMLSLFLSELKAVSLTASTLALVNMLDDSDAQGVIDSLIHAGLAVATEENSEPRTVGLTALGSARMRSFVSDYPEV